MFTHLKFVFCGIPVLEVKHLGEIVKENGGEVVYTINEKTSFVVTTSKEVENQTLKIRNAKKNNVPLVSTNFIDTCLNYGHLIDVQPFLLDSSIEKNNEQKKTNQYQTEPNEQQINCTFPELSIQNPNQNVDSLQYTNSPQKQISIPKREHYSIGKWQSVRVFISSTFKDMHGERDYLTRHIFPELQERCNKLRVHIHPVDLRWGVTEEEAFNTLELCLTEIDSCRPFFLGLLGERYGWCPETYNVPNLSEYKWINELPQGKSITHVEILYGVLRDPKKTRAVFCFRDPTFIQNVPLLYVNDFKNQSSEHSYELSKLKEEIKQASKDNPKNIVLFENYSCSWKGIVDSKPMVGNLEIFGEFVLNQLWHFIQQEFKVERDSDTDETLSLERSYHEQFIESHSRLFVGRESLLNAIHSHCERSRRSSTPNVPLVILGEPGAGKTSLVSAFVRQYMQEMKQHEDCFVLPHFIGAAPGSTNIRSTLVRINKELSFQYQFNDNIPEDYQELQILFKKLLEKISEDNTKPALVLIIDALNQLDESYHSHTLDWLPETFPARICVVLSTLRGDIYDQLKHRAIKELFVGELNQFEREEIVRKMLSQYGKKLTEAQMHQLLQKQDAPKPLYLIVACEELRVFGIFEKLNEFISKLPQTVPDLFEQVLSRLESDHGPELVQMAMSLLCCSRGGLLESELLSLLGEDLHTPLAHAVWARLYRSLKHYLRPPGESGSEGVLDFFHQQLPKAVRRRYLTGTKGDKYSLMIHSRLAEYFLSKCDPQGDFNFAAGHMRGLNFTPYHLTFSENWEELRHTLCNLAFIESKCELGMAYDLVSDFLLVCSKQNQIPRKLMIEFEEWRRFVQQRTHVLTKYPTLTFSLAASMPDTSGPAQQAASRYSQLLETRPWFKWTNKPQTPSPCVMTITAHELVVRCCAYFPASLSTPSLIVTCSDDKTLKLWNAITGEGLKTFKGHKSCVLTCKFSPDGKFVVSGSQDKTIKIWNVETGLEVVTLKGHKMSVNSVAYSPDGKFIASGSQDKTVKIWSVKTYLLVATLAETKRGHASAVRSVCWSSDGKFLATGGDDGIRIWTINENSQFECSAVLSGHSKAVNCVVFSPDSKQIASASDDRLVKLWNIESGAEVMNFVGHHDCVACVAFTNDGTKIVSSSHDNLIIIWDVVSGTVKTKMIGHTGTVFKVEYTPDNKFIISCSFDRSVKIWEVQEKTEIIGHEARLLSIHFSGDGKYIATGSRDKTIKIWETATAKELQHLMGHTSNVFCVRWSPDGKFLLSASRDKTLKIWSRTTTDLWTCIQTLEGHSGEVNAGEWSPDGKFLLSASDDKTLRVWNVAENFKCVAILYGHRSPVLSCVYNNFGDQAASGSADGIIKLWNTKLGKQNYGTSYVKVATLVGHQKGVTSLGFSNNDSRLLSGSEDNTLREWNPKNAKSLTILNRHREAVTDCGYTPNDRYIMSGSTDCCFILWEATTKQVVAMFACLSRICAVATSDKTQQFAIGDGAGGFYLLSLVGLPY